MLGVFRPVVVALVNDLDALHTPKLLSRFFPCISNGLGIYDVRAAVNENTL